MSVIAFIPVRGGSKSIPFKNVKKINGKPLIWWVLNACQKSKKISKIVVATDSEKIKKVIKKFQMNKIEFFKRSDESATDTASTEFVILEYINAVKLPKKSTFALIQATNPFLKAIDLDSAILKLNRNQTAKSILSVVRTKRFYWDGNKPLNYDPLNRPRRQDFDGWQMENGAFYISHVGDILKNKCRLAKPILTYEMEEYTGFEIDEPDDWIICENLLKRHS